MELNKSILQRLSFIDKRISSGSFPNKQILSDEFEVHPKTIQRDIDYLKTFYDAPIEYDPRRKGFYYSKSFSLNAFTLSEMDFFVLAVTEKVLRQYKGTPFSKRIQKFYDKLSPFFDGNVSIKPDELDELIHYDIGAVREVNREYFDLIEEGLFKKKVLELLYYTQHKGTTSLRKVEPYLLKNYRGDWYLVGFCLKTNGLRVFALNRIKHLSLINEHFEKRNDLNVKKLFKDSFGIYVDNKKHKVKLKFTPYQSRWIKEKKWHQTQSIKENKDGSINLEMEVNNLEEVKRWVLQYGKECEVLKPERLRKEIMEEVRELNRFYN